GVWAGRGRGDEVRDPAALRAPAGERPRRGIVGIVGGIVRADADELYATPGVVPAALDDAFLHRLHVRAVVADEHHHQRLGRLEIVAREGLAVDRPEPEVGTRR